MKVAVGLRRVAAGKRTSGRRAAQIAIKVQNYPLDAIFEKKLLFSIPFYIFRYEKEFPEMEQNDEKRQRLEEDYVRIQKKLTELCEAEVQEIHGLKV